MSSLLLFWGSTIYIFIDYIKFNSNINIVFNLGPWLSISNQSKIDFLLTIDTLSFTFILLTASIAMFVYIYAFVYFRGEPNVERLIVFLNLFVLSMILMVSGGNFVILFLGWELIGVTSFFLINFWSTRVGTGKAGFKAFFFNRISDVALFYLCVFVYYYFNTTDIKVVIQGFKSAPYLMYGNYNYINVFALIMVTPIFIKSAQLFGHVWLPDSMEAPVPASALIHSATLVSAGIYLILRFKAVLILSYYFMLIVPVVGSLTALYGAAVSSAQSDAKRILAYSTISHCGFLVVSAVLCDVEYTLFYLLVHGFFKASSFICVGNIIRFNGGGQDIKLAGGFSKYLVFEAFALLSSFIYLAGVPFSLGFFMKHFVLENLVQQRIYFYVVFSICFLASVFGVIYCSRLYYNVFFSFKKGHKYTYKNASNLDLANWDKYNKFYSASTLLGRFSIVILICTGIIISYTYFLFFSLKGVNFGNFDFSSFAKYNFLLKYILVLSNIFSLYYINIFVIFVLIFLFSFCFSKTFNNYFIFSSIVRLLLLVFFFIFIKSII